MTVTNTELGYVSGVTSTIQTQLNALKNRVKMINFVYSAAGGISVTKTSGCNTATVSTTNLTIPFTTAIGSVLDVTISQESWGETGTTRTTFVHTVSQ